MKTETKPKVKSLYLPLDSFYQTKNDGSDIDWDDLEEEAARNHNPSWPPYDQCPPPYKGAPPLDCSVVDPRKELRDKIELVKEQIKLEEEYQDLIGQLEKLKTGKSAGTKNSHPTKIHPVPHRSQPKQHVIIPELDDADTFAVTETVDGQGQFWCHHTGFNLKLIKELKMALKHYDLRLFRLLL